VKLGRHWRQIDNATAPHTYTFDIMQTEWPASILFSPAFKVFIIDKLRFFLGVVVKFKNLLYFDRVNILIS